VHVTTKTHNLRWLASRGAGRVELMGNAFDPAIHRPIFLDNAARAKFGCNIGFVGHWEPSRERLLLSLYRRYPGIKVWGGGWERARERRHPLFKHCPHLIGDDYAKAIGGAKINLCLVSQWFGDKTTTRSVEVPACGKFMLAERNEEHLALFREGVEAEFYDTPSEMFRKIDYYLANDDEREKIAAAGRQRCTAEYSNKLRLNTVLNRILESSGQ